MQQYNTTMASTQGLQQPSQPTLTTYSNRLLTIVEDNWKLVNRLTEAVGRAKGMPEGKDSKTAPKAVPNGILSQIDMSLNELSTIEEYMRSLLNELESIV